MLHYKLFNFYKQFQKHIEDVSILLDEIKTILNFFINIFIILMYLYLHLLFKYLIY